MATLSLEKLTRRYDGAEGLALDALDLEVKDGEVLCMVGPSGCGKSTTLRLVAGLDRADGGAVRIDGADVVRVAPQDRDVAMVFQGYALYPHLSVAENIGFPLRMRSVGRAERETRVTEAASMLGIGKLLSRHPGELSGGERQRVAMGRALVRKPKIFLFDEPLANLDAALRTELRVELGALLRRLGTTTIYVTHDQVEAMTLGDRIAVLRGGRLEQASTPRALYEDPATRFVASFLGSPPANLVDCTREADAFVAGSLRLPAEHDRARITAAIRPEHISVTGEDDPRSVQATLLAAEPLGAESLVHVDAGGVRITARQSGFFVAERGAPIRLAFDPSRVLYFDSDTGARIRAEAR